VDKKGTRPKVGGLTQSLVRNVVCGETEAVDLKEYMILGNGLWNITFDYYPLIRILARRRPGVTKYDVFHLSNDSECFDVADEILKSGTVH
jgi:hypothetical protein